MPWLPLETFDLFSKLPPELRNRIWKYSLPAPRLITIILENAKPLDTVNVDRGNGFKDRTKRVDLDGSTTSFTKQHEMSSSKKLSAPLRL